MHYMLERTRNNFVLLFFLFSGRVHPVVQQFDKSDFCIFLPQRTGFPVPGPNNKMHSTERYKSVGLR